MRLIVGRLLAAVAEIHAVDCLADWISRYPFDRSFRGGGEQQFKIFAVVQNMIQ